MDNRMISNEITEEEISDIIEIRSEPHIYAFSTNTVPNYIKVGDTFRPISKRLQEWQKEYADLKRLFPNINNELEGVAKVNDEIYFRDYSVHKYLERNDFCRLTQEELNRITHNKAYFSNEFFKNISIDDIKKGIAEIKENYNSSEPNLDYQYYKVADRKADDFHWSNDKDWKLRDNQQQVVKNFLSKAESEKTLLMYAVMRFGKSFTAISCAKAKDCKKVLVVSAKADVASEWKRTVEMPKCFKEFRFLWDKDFVENPNVIEDTLSHNVAKEFKEKTGVVAFLTLQNLIGKSSEGKNIKKKLEKVFETQFDLIIVDETHFGAWAETYGAPLNKEEDSDAVDKECKDFQKFQDETNKLKAKLKLHLSGTPYNLLFDERFTEKNIIAACQFSDILHDKEEWDNLHRKDIDAGEINPATRLPYEEYDNPYFGFPKMLRFAFNLPASTEAKLNRLTKDGKKWTLNNLFETNKNKDDIKFLFEEDVLKLLQIIDGSESDERILSFLEIPKIKDNDVCKHIVIVLPFKFSCDAMEKLLNSNKEKFINLKDYKVLNITGHNLKSELKTIENIKSQISKYERNGDKTITLTVRKMLTGITVPEWDTMIMLKDTTSPQEYDQAIYRIQNQYIKEIEQITDSQCKKIAKIDMKPQTILVDFNPIRMFELQGLSTRTINKIKTEQKDLNKALEVELNNFPIIAYNAEKLVKVTPTNIVELIANYNKNVSILESSNKVNLDMAMLENKGIFNFINSQSEKGITSKLSGHTHTGEEVDIDVDVIGNENSDNEGNADNPNSQTQQLPDNNKKDEKKIVEKYRKCIARLMFFAFLTRSDVNTLSEIVEVVENQNEYQDENKRIFKNLQLNLDFIKEHISICKKSYAIEVDNAIIQANLLSRDKNLTQEQKLENAMARFSRISESEVVTPIKVCNEMYNAIGLEKLVDIINNDGKILDIASKTGEFSIALYKLLKDRIDSEKLKNSIYSIPTSTITYEFTRRIYEILDLNTENIAENFTSYNLLEIKKLDRDGKETVKIDHNKACDILTQNKSFCDIDINASITKGDKKVKFGAIVGNPPYQEETIKNSGQNPRTNIFHHFETLSMKLANEYSCLIFPGIRWIHQTGKGQDFKSFAKDLINNIQLEKIIFYSDAREVFVDSGIADGISIVLTNKNKKNNGFEYNYKDKDRINVLSCENPGNDLMLIDPSDKEVFERIKKTIVLNNFDYLNNSILARSLFEIESDFVEKNKTKVKLLKDGEEIDYSKKIKLLTNDKAGSAGRAFWYVVDRNTIKKENQKYINEWQVIVSSAHPGGQQNRDNMIAVADNHSAFGRARVALKSFNCEDGEQQAKNFLKYCNSYLIKYAFLLTSESLSSLGKKVPDIGDYSNNNKYNIDFSKDINKALFDLFDIKDVSMINYIKERVENARPLKN